MTLTTSLELLRSHRPCKDGYAQLVAAVGSDWHDDVPIPLARILESNGLNDALWALRAVPTEQVAQRARLARIFACDCAERVLPLFEATYPGDARPRVAIETARRFAHGEASAVELAMAADAAHQASVGAASYVVIAAAWAARDAAGCAGNVEGGAARHARAAARVATRYDADGAAERTWQVQHLREMLETG